MKDRNYTFRPKSLRELLNTLDEREHKILIYRYGLFDEEEHSFVEMKKYFDVNPKRIREIHKKALRKLAHSSRAVYAAFLPDDLMEAAFGMTDLRQIARSHSEKHSIEEIKSSIERLLESKQSKTDCYIQEMRENYRTFVEVLQGSELMKFLKAVDAMAGRIEGQRKNVQHTLDILMNFLSKEIKLPQTELSNILGELGRIVHSFSNIERQLRDTVDRRILLVGKNEN